VEKVENGIARIKGDFELPGGDLREVYLNPCSRRIKLGQGRYASMQKSWKTKATK
jgi:hypothetical protein